MKKIVSALLFCLSLLSAESADRTGPYIAAGIGYAIFNDDQRMEAETVDSSYNLNIIGGVFINKYLSVELSYDYFKVFENSFNANTTKVSIIDVDAKAHYPLWRERIDLYAAFGAGEIMWRETLNGVVQDDTSGVLRGDVGVGFRALDYLTLNLGYRRYFFQLDHNIGTADNIIYERYNMSVSSAYATIEVLF